MSDMDWNYNKIYANGYVFGKTDRCKLASVAICKACGQHRT